MIKKEKKFIKNSTNNAKPIKKNVVQKGLSDSGSELLQNILASQHQTNQLSSVSHEAEQMNQRREMEALKQLASYGTQLDDKRFNQQLKIAEQQSKIDSIEADLFNRQNQINFESQQDILNKNTQLQNQAISNTKEQSQKIANLNTEANIQKNHQLWKNRMEALKNAYAIQLNRDKHELDRVYKLSSLNQ